nr:unnamed protein product [Digitaria exilis]
MEATAGTSVFRPVLLKLQSSLLARGDELTPDLEERRCDIEFMISELEPVLSILEKTWEVDDLWTSEARKLPNQIKDRIDELVVDMMALGAGTSASINLLEGVKLEVQRLVRRFFQIFERIVHRIREEDIFSSSRQQQQIDDKEAATGALGPVLLKLNSLGSTLGVEETSRGDILLIISGLKPVHSFLESAWSREHDGREGFVEVFKDWMAEARELSLEIDAKIDEIVAHGVVGTSSLLEGIELQVQHLVCRFLERLAHDDDDTNTSSNSSSSSSCSETSERDEASTDGTAVTVATGALGPVLVKLQSLLVADEGTPAGLEEEESRSDIEFIISKLQPVHSLLERIWEREDDLDAACKDWTVKARDLSYIIWDSIDHLVLGSMAHGGRTTTSLITEIKLKVQGLVDSPCWEELVTLHQTITTTSNNRSSSEPAALVGARFLLHKRESESSELVGMEDKQAELTKLLQQRGAVCILGFAGMGKTTLADLVYQDMRERFECHAFVSISRRGNMTEVMAAILSQLITAQDHGPSASNEPPPPPAADKRY